MTTPISPPASKSCSRDYFTHFPNELLEEIANEEPTPLREYVARELTAITQDPYFAYLTESALHGYGRLAAQRAERLQAQMRALIASIESVTAREN